MQLARTLNRNLARCPASPPPRTRLPVFPMGDSEWALAIQTRSTRALLSIQKSFKFYFTRCSLSRAMVGKEGGKAKPLKAKVGGNGRPDC